MIKQGSGIAWKREKRVNRKTARFFSAFFRNKPALPPAYFYAKHLLLFSLLALVLFTFPWQETASGWPGHFWPAILAAAFLPVFFRVLEKESSGLLNAKRELEKINAGQKSLLRACNRISGRMEPAGVSRSTLAGISLFLPYSRGLVLIEESAGNWAVASTRHIPRREAEETALFLARSGALVPDPENTRVPPRGRAPSKKNGKPLALPGKWKNPCLVFLPTGKDGPPVACLVIDQLKPAFEATRDQVKILAEVAGSALARGKLYHEISRLSTIDPMTGLFNHRYFCERAEQEIRDSLRYGFPLAIMLSDIDDFKSHVDLYGHLSADHALQEMGKLVAGAVGPDDVVGRWGGDEFVYLLPGAGQPEATAVARRIQKLTGENLPSGKGEEGRFTLSFGVALFPGHGSDWLEVLANADKALFAAKKEGKNRTCFYHG